MNTFKVGDLVTLFNKDVGSFVRSDGLDPHSPIRIVGLDEDGICVFITPAKRRYSHIHFRLFKPKEPIKYKLKIIKIGGKK